MSAALWLWDFLRWVIGGLKYLVPRFITEDVCLERVGPGDGVDAFDIVCAMEDAAPGERFDAMGTVDALVWLCFAVTYRFGNIRPFVNPHDDGVVR